MRDFLAVTKALADETRVRLLLALRDHELCLCQLVELVALASSTVSKHMSILRQRHSSMAARMDAGCTTGWPTTILPLLSDGYRVGRFQKTALACQSLGSRCMPLWCDAGQRSALRPAASVRTMLPGDETFRVQ